MINTIVRNFQSVKEAKINISGLTVLRGESNAGKSSYLKALYAATHNRFRSIRISSHVEISTSLENHE